MKPMQVKLWKAVIRTADCEFTINVAHQSETIAAEIAKARARELANDQAYGCTLFATRDTVFVVGM